MQPHRFDAVSFLFGVLFVLLGGVALLQPAVGLALMWPWVVPVAALTLGVAVLLSLHSSGGADET